MTQEQNKTKNAVKELYIKAILMLVALILLVAALVFFTTAWYTKMVSTAGVNLRAAQWDFTANHTVDSVNINVYEYNSLNQGRAAPGTGGYIPVLLGAQQSDTDIEYTLTVDRSAMSQEFQKRIFFYYMKKDADNKDVRVYFDGSPENLNAQEEQLVGTVKRGSTLTVNVYWEWLYEAPATATEAEKLAWNEFDTKVGENPDLYTDEMNVTVTVAGVEFKHTTTATTPSTPGGSGTEK